MAPKWSNLDRFLMFFGPHFPIKFRDSLNFLKSNKYNAKTSFFTPQGTSFSHQFSIIIWCFVRHRSQASFFFFLYKNARFGDPFKIQWPPKRHPKSTKSRQNDDKLLVAFVFFVGPSFLMYLCCPLVSFWHNFASNEHQNATPNQHLAPKSEQENPPPLLEGGQGVLDQRG